MSFVRAVVRFTIKTELSNEPNSRDIYTAAKLKTDYDISKKLRDRWYNQI